MIMKLKCRMTALICGYLYLIYMRSNKSLTSKACPLCSHLSNMLRQLLLVIHNYTYLPEGGETLNPKQIAMWIFQTRIWCDIWLQRIKKVKIAPTTNHASLEQQGSLRRNKGVCNMPHIGRKMKTCLCCQLSLFCHLK